MIATYTPRDPRIEVWCASCRFGNHPDCIGDGKVIPALALAAAFTAGYLACLLVSWLMMRYDAPQIAPRRRRTDAGDSHGPTRCATRLGAGTMPTRRAAGRGRGAPMARYSTRWW